MSLKTSLFTLAVAFLLASLLTVQAMAQPYAPADYFPLVMGNHWRYYTQWDTTQPQNNRWTYCDITNTEYFGSYGETLSYRVEWSEQLSGQLDTTLYHVEYQSYNLSGDLGWTGLINYENSVILDSIIFDTLAVVMRNPLTVGDSSVWTAPNFTITYEILSLTDTLILPLGNFQNCLHLQQRVVLNDQLFKIRNEYHILDSYYPVIGIGRFNDLDWPGTDSSHYSRGYLLDCEVEPMLSVRPISGKIPLRFILHQNYPNPFNPVTEIAYILQHPGKINISIFDPLGRIIRSYEHQHNVPGEYSIIWDGRDLQGNSCASGRYFYSLLTSNSRATKQMLLLK